MMEQARPPDVLELAQPEDDRSLPLRGELNGRGGDHVSDQPDDPNDDGEDRVDCRQRCDDSPTHQQQNHEHQCSDVVDHGYPSTPADPCLRSTLVRRPLRESGRHRIQKFDFFLTSRTCGDSARVKSTISSPVTVLMSWCRLSTLVPVISRTIASMSGRAVSIRWVRTCLSRSLPLSAGSDFTRCCSAAVKTPERRTTTRLSIKCVRISLGPRPMNSCSNRLIPWQMEASISPCVFMVTSNASDAADARPHSVRSAVQPSTARPCWGRLTLIVQENKK